MTQDSEVKGTQIGYNEHYYTLLYTISCPNYGMFSLPGPWIICYYYEIYGYAHAFPVVK